MKKWLLLLIISFFAISITGCREKKEEDRFQIEKQKEEEMLSCLVNELGAYIVTEESELMNIPQNTFTNKSKKITYYNASLTDDENIYAIVKSDDHEVIRDFDMYFSNKFETYQTYFTNDNIYVYLHNNLNDINLNDLKKCSIKNEFEVNKKEIDSKTIEKLNKTNKIVIKAGDNELGTITNKEVVNEILNTISSSKQYGDAFLCDGHGFDFEMYNDKGKLIDTIYVWDDGRLIPESIHSGCSYYNITNNVDIREIIERETNYIFYNLYSLSDSCEELELIYEDKYYKYYFNCQEYGKTLIRFDLTGLKMKIKYAIDNNYITIDQLYDDMIIKEEK